MSNALDKQVGGSHYKDLVIQPVEYCYMNNLGYMEGNVIKYVTRYRFKEDPLKDLEKAKHYIELLIEFEKCQAGAMESMLDEGLDVTSQIIADKMMENNPLQAWDNWARESTADYLTYNREDGL